MPQLTPIELEDGTFIYIEATENIDTPTELDFLTGTPDKSTPRDFNPQKQVGQNFQKIEHTVRTYTSHLLNSFKNLAAAEVSEVTLEFGVNVGGMTGIPYIATGNTNCNVKITVKCVFPKEDKK